MACLTPKKIFITNSKGYDILTYQRCGTCYNCQCETRGEWVFRVQAEVELRLPFFITLTYDNKHLPIYEPALKEFHFSRSKYIQYQMNLHKLKRTWDYSFVRKDHLRDFFIDFQKLFQERYFDRLPIERYLYTAPNGNQFYRNRPLPGQEQNILVRRYSTGEYGTFSHRAHYHALLFFPISIHRQDVIKMCQELWPYGHVDVAKDCRNAAVNYVAKHQVKSDSGSTFQRRFSPIFKSVSTYKGGIGCNLKYDESNYTRYKHVDINNEFDQRYFTVIDSQGHEYKIQFPRFLSNYFRKRYAAEKGITENLTDEELNDLSKKTKEIFCKEFIKFISCAPDLNNATRDTQLMEFYRSAKHADYMQRKSYETKRYNQKKMTLLKKYGFTLNDLSDEPF